MVAKRKIAFQESNGGEDKGNPPKTVRRNARERNRVKNIDMGFDNLKLHIPTTAQQKKISRVRILSSAVEYIQHLHTLLNQHESVCRNPALIKNEPHSPSPNNPPDSSTSSPHIPLRHPYSYPHPHFPQMYNNHPPLISPPNPVYPGYTPTHNVYSDTASVASSGYYSSTLSADSPSQLSPLIQQHSSNIKDDQYPGFKKETLSPSSHSTYSDSSVQSSFVTAATPTVAEGYQDMPDDYILDTIVNWEKY